MSLHPPYSYQIPKKKSDKHKLYEKIKWKCVYPQLDTLKVALEEKGTGTMYYMCYSLQTTKDKVEQGSDSLVTS